SHGAGSAQGTQGTQDTAGNALVERVVARAGGVPFFLVSYARSPQTLAELHEQRRESPRTAGDAQVGAPGPLRRRPQSRRPVPWNVTQGIGERVAALPTSAQELLGVAAVVGQPAAGAVLSEGAGQPEVEALSGLETACQAGLLVEEQQRGQPAHYRFTHDLI